MNRCWRDVVISLALICCTNGAAQADSPTGEQLYDIACSACHSLAHTPDHHIGPPLGGLLNRATGAVEGYRYSEALRNSGWRWSLPALLAWLTDPDTAIPNNAMNYVNPMTAEETQRLGEWLLEES